MATDQPLLASLSLSGQSLWSTGAQLVMQLLNDYQVGVLDIRQTTTYDEMSLSALVFLPSGSTDGSFELLQLKLQELARQFDFVMRLVLVDSGMHSRQEQQPANSGHILTVLAWRLTGGILAGVAGLVTGAGLIIEDIRQLTRRAKFDPKTESDSAVCVELTLKGEPDNVTAFRLQTLQLAGSLGVDIAFQRDDLFRRNRRLVVFDMDSTLIKTEVIDELARVAGVGDEVMAITEQAMQGQLPFNASLTARVRLLEGLPRSALDKVAAGLSLADGAEKLLRILQQLDLRTAIISGGFRYFGEQLQKRLGIDYLYANELEIESECLTGRVTGEVIDGERKALILRDIAASEGLDLRQVIAVGDGANDLPMLDIAGLGIAYRAKPIVRQAAQQAISNHGWMAFSICLV